MPWLARFTRKSFVTFAVWLVLRNVRQLQILCAVFRNEIPSAPASPSPSSKSKYCAVRSASSGMTLMSRRVSGFMVVIHIISGSFSPRPLERWMVIFLPSNLLENLRLLLLVVGKPGLVLAGDLKQRRLRDIHISLPDQRRAQPVEHGQDQRPDLKAVHVGIGTDDHLVPAQTAPGRRTTAPLPCLPCTSTPQPKTFIRSVMMSLLKILS